MTSQEPYVNAAVASPTIFDVDQDNFETEVLQASLKTPVLVDFWATWCGPCVGEIPHVKEAYDQYHDKGFEIVGISFDGDKSALQKFVKSHVLPWPQYFDGKAWGNKFGMRFGIQAIPTMWLVDQNGNVVDTHARSDLAEKVGRLLGEPSASATN
jgi:thioredoxin-like negative regulator of GroEL